MIRLPFLIACLVMLTLIGLFTPALRAAAQSHGPALPTCGMHDAASMHSQMADVKAADARLQALVKDMDAAIGESKIAAMAAVLRELVEQQKAMRSRMADMHQHMDARGEATKPARPQDHQHATVD
jgi:hypothetical protein